MKEFNKFYFESFEFDEKTLEAKFNYSFDKEEYFTETIGFRTEKKIRKDLNKYIINNILFHIHIALWISYYKLSPTKDLIIESGFLDDYQIVFWKKFYIEWLGEFFITNNIDPNPLLNFINTENSRKFEKKDFDLDDKLLLALWGGKDSIVSYSLIKDLDFDTYVFGKLDNIKISTSNTMGKNPLLITRKLSDNLFKLNTQGYYNGHVPITWIIAFVSELFCYLYNYKYIVLSNEKSASEENTIWKWIKINHQYSKSLEFEKDFSEYVSKNISSDIKYFSLLRWMYEYKIAEIFSKQKDFFDDFSSCNNNFKITGETQNKLWCNKCEKCSFVFLILSNFLSIEELENIFGENLFNKESLKDTFAELAWLSNHKPFECVWTYEESFLSLFNAVKRYSENFIVLKNLKNKVMQESKKIDMKNLEEKLLKIYDEDIIPKEIKSKIKF